MSTSAEDRITNILVAGIGGQGVMTAAEVLSQTAVSQGYDVKKTEVAGMAQRGGVVTSHVRFGRRVLSPAIPMARPTFWLASSRPRPCAGAASCATGAWPWSTACARSRRW